MTIWIVAIVWVGLVWLICRWMSSAVRGADWDERGRVRRAMRKGRFPWQLLIYIMLASPAAASPISTWEVKLVGQAPYSLTIDYGQDEGSLAVVFASVAFTMPVLVDPELGDGLLPLQVSAIALNPPEMPGYEIFSIGMDFETMYAGILVHVPTGGFDHRAFRVSIQSVRLVVPEPSEAGLVALLGLLVLGASVARGRAHE